MSDLLKDLITREYLQEIAVDIQSAYPPFQVEAFLNATFSSPWDALELKGRMKHIAMTLGKFLPQDYPEAISIIDKTIVNQGNWRDSLCWFFLDFIEIFGQDEEYWDVSISAMARYTRYASAEFAVRPFIINHQERMMAQMYEWSKNECEHIRRLSSEGCRPALPWGQALNAFKKDPAPVLPILAQLKTDPAIYVRKSVANNLNDISKTHPDLVAKIAKDWYGENEHTNWIVKHGCRTLLKKGNAEVLSLFGFDNAESIDFDGFSLQPSAVNIGEEITFSFTIHLKSPTKVRLEYAIDFVKANGKRNRKIFQISEIAMKENEKKTYTKKHSLADLSTRKHYGGMHSLSIIINGAERGTLDFELNN
ncbi:MAG: DNA alkylation repair protein [Defluviitaleaceae bacterium]|nr:DNA alkylation repair protein [Defluviitaleaceae bacterium]